MSSYVSAYTCTHACIQHTRTGWAPELNEQIGTIRMRKRRVHLLQSRKSWQILLKVCTSRIPVGACIQQQWRKAAETRVCRAYHKIWCRSYTCCRTRWYVTGSRRVVSGHSGIDTTIPPRSPGIGARGRKDLSNPASGSIIPQTYDSITRCKLNGSRCSAFAARCYDASGATTRDR